MAVFYTDGSRPATNWQYIDLRSHESVAKADGLIGISQTRDIKEAAPMEVTRGPTDT